MGRAAVIFVIFNRPEHTSRVFQLIRAERPSRLFVVADGPRIGRPGELEKCLEVRRIVEEGVDWPCEVVKDYSDVNLGCELRPALGITRAFRQVDEAIILEDDCLPDPSFFKFCDELLERYRDDHRIAQIGGVNFQAGKMRGDGSYYFSRYPHCWGWATWSRSWADYEREMSNWPELERQGWLLQFLEQPRESAFWTSIFNQVYNGLIEAWDYRWVFACWRHSRLSIVPQVNLVSNIGFGVGATHTNKHTSTIEIPLQQISFPLVHPIRIYRNHDADNYTWRNVFSAPPLYRRILNRLYRRPR